MASAILKLVPLVVLFGLLSFAGAEEESSQRRSRSDVTSAPGRALAEGAWPGIPGTSTQAVGWAVPTTTAGVQDWRDAAGQQQDYAATATAIPTKRPGLFVGSDPKKRAIVTGVVAGVGVSALAGGIAIAIEETKMHKAMKEGRPWKPLIPGLGFQGPPSISAKKGGGWPRPEPASTALSGWAAAGSNELPVSSQDGFHIGDRVVLDQGSEHEEVGKIVKFGSLILESPLKFTHASGTTVAAVLKDEAASLKANEAARTILAKQALVVAASSTTTPAPAAAGKTEIPIPVWIALAVLVCCCCLALLAAVLEAMFNKKGGSRKRTKSKRETSRSLSVDTNDEEYYSDNGNSASYVSVAPQEQPIPTYYDPNVYPYNYAQPTTEVPMMYAPQSYGPATYATYGAQGYSAAAYPPTIMPYAGYNQPGYS